MDSSTTDGFSMVNDPMSTNVPLRSSHRLGNLSPHGDPVKLLYSKSKVYVHPSASTNDYIPGFISIVEKLPHEYLVAWTPEESILSRDMDAFVQVDAKPEEQDDVLASTVLIPAVDYDSNKSDLYAFSSRVDTIHSIAVHPPSFTKWYGSVVVNFKDGHSSLPLWFHDDESQSTLLQKNTQGGKVHTDDHHAGQHWGGDLFIDRLSHLIPIIQSSKDPHLYLVKDKTESDFQHPVSEKERLLQTPERTPERAPDRHEPFQLFESAQMDPVIAALKEARWNILEKFSKVTRLSKDAAASILGHPASKSILPLLPPSIQELSKNETVRATMDDYDSARIYLAKWAAGLASRADQEAPLDRRYRNVGIWGHDDGLEEDTVLGIFEILNSESDKSIPTHSRTDAVSREQWLSFFDKEGRLSVGEPYARQCIFSGGLHPSIRKEAWLFLLNVYPWDSSQQEREQIAEKKRQEYAELKSRWADNPTMGESPEFLDQKHRIDKDVHRTDRTVPFYAKEDMANPDSVLHAGTNQHLETLKEILCTYNMYNTDLDHGRQGYVQGMSDLVSPLYAVIEEEHLVFAAFVGFMERMKNNFLMDQSGMHRQLLTMDTLIQFMDPALYKHLQQTDSFNLFFCFRWFLVWFKREFAWEDTMTLWEVLWTNHLTDQFHFFVALSILDQHRSIIIDYLKNFDEVLKYINDLSMTMNVRETLQRAEILYYQFRQRVDAVKSKHDQMKKEQSDTRRGEKSAQESGIDLATLQRLITKMEESRI